MTPTVVPTGRLASHLRLGRDRPAILVADPSGARIAPLFAAKFMASATMILPHRQAARAIPFWPSNSIPSPILRRCCAGNDRVASSFLIRKRYP